MGAKHEMTGPERRLLPALLLLLLVPCCALRERSSSSGVDGDPGAPLRGEDLGPARDEPAPPREVTIAAAGDVLIHRRVLESARAHPRRFRHVLGAMGENAINIELLAESFDLDDCGNFSLVVDQKDLDQAIEILERVQPIIDAGAVSYTPDVAVITIFSHHLREKPYIHGLMFSSMASAGISSLAISTSISSVSCVIEGQHLELAVQTLSAAFDIPFEVKKRPKDY